MKLFGMVATLDMLPCLGGIMDALTGLPRRIEYCHRRFDSFFEMLLKEHLDLAMQRSEQDIIDVLLSLSNDEKVHFSPNKENIKAVLMVRRAWQVALVSHTLFFFFYGITIHTFFFVSYPANPNY